LHHHKIRLHDEIRDLDMEDEERRFKVLERAKNRDEPPNYIDSNEAQK
jgi:hypothetical protein